MMSGWHFTKYEEEPVLGRHARESLHRGIVIGTGFQCEDKLLPCLIPLVQAELAEADEKVGIGDLGALCCRDVGLTRSLSIGRCAQRLGADIDQLLEDCSGAILLAKFPKRHRPVRKRGILNVHARG